MSEVKSEVKDDFVRTLEERETFYKTQLNQYSENFKRMQETIGILNGGIQGILEAKSLYLKNQTKSDLPVTDEVK